MVKKKYRHNLIMEYFKYINFNSRQIFIFFLFSKLNYNYYKFHVSISIKKIAVFVPSVLAKSMLGKKGCPI